MPVNYEQIKQQMKKSIEDMKNHQDLKDFLEKHHGLDFIFIYEEIARDLSAKVIDLINNNSLDVNDVCNIFIYYPNMFNRQPLLEKLPDLLQEKFNNYRKTNKQDQKDIIKDLEATNKQLSKTVRVLKEDLEFKYAALNEAKSRGKKSIRGKYKSSKVEELRVFKEELNEGYESLIESLNIEKTQKKESMESISKELQREIESFQDNISQHTSIKKWFDLWIKEKRGRLNVRELQAIAQQLEVANEFAPVMFNLNENQKEQYINLLTTFQQKVFSSDAALPDMLNAGNTLIQELKNLTINEAKSQPRLTQAIEQLEENVKQEQTKTGKILSENEILQMLSDTPNVENNYLFTMIANQKIIDSAKKFIQTEIKDYNSLDNFIANFMDKTNNVPLHLLSITNEIKGSLTEKFIELINQTPSAFKGNFAHLSNLFGLDGVSNILDFNKLLKEDIFNNIAEKIQEDLADITSDLDKKQDKLSENLAEYERNIAKLQEKNDKAVQAQLKDISLLNRKIKITAKESLKYKVFGKAIKLLSKIGILDSFERIQKSQIEDDSLSKIRTDYFKELSDEKSKKAVDIKKLKGDYVSEKLELKRDLNNAVRAKKEELSSNLFSKYLQSYKERKEQAVYEEEYKFLEDNYAKLNGMFENSGNLDEVVKVFKEIYQSTKDELAKHKHGHSKAKKELRKALPLSKKFIKYFNDLNGSINRLTGLFFNTRTLDDAKVTITAASEQLIGNSEEREKAAIKIQQAFREHSVRTKSAALRREDSNKTLEKPTQSSSILAKLVKFPSSLMSITAGLLNPNSTEINDASADFGLPRSISFSGLPTPEAENSHRLRKSKSDSDLLPKRPVERHHQAGEKFFSDFKADNPRRDDFFDLTGSSKELSSPNRFSVPSFNSQRTSRLRSYAPEPMDGNTPVLKDKSVLFRSEDTLPPSSFSKKPNKWGLVFQKAQKVITNLKTNQTVFYSEGLLKINDEKKLSKIKIFKQTFSGKLNKYNRAEYSFNISNENPAELNIGLSLTVLGSGFKHSDTINLIKLKHGEIIITDDQALEKFVNSNITVSPNVSKEEISIAKQELTIKLKKLRLDVLKEIIQNSYNSEINIGSEVAKILQGFTLKPKLLSQNNLGVNHEEDASKPKSERGAR